MVLLTLEVSEDRILQSDFDAWHFVLWETSVPASGDEDTTKDNAEKTYPRILDLSLMRSIMQHPNYGTSGGRQYIQCVFWEINPEDIISHRFVSSYPSPKREKHP
jgi:hypothetical protein